MSNFGSIADDNKPSSKVLRPPGGGSSDIFGAELPQTPRVVKNHMQSNIFSTDKDANVKNTIRQGAHRFYFIGDQPRRAQKNLDSYQRLFGEPERPFTPAKNHMKSNIPFGAKTEAAQQLLTNGTNGHAHHNHSTSGKTGSVSSASSSVSSSTENLKMNGFSKSADKDMCAKTPTPESSTESVKNETLSMDQSCNNTDAAAAGAGEPRSDAQSVSGTPRSNSGNVFDSSRNPITGLGLNGDGVGGWKPKTPKQRGQTQTLRNTGTNPEYPYSFSIPVNPLEGVDSSGLCGGERMKLIELRNPLDDMDLDDCVTGQRSLKARNREGNPVTGEGYTGPVSVPGVTPVVNKNRVPPGGYSSGLW